MISTLNHNSTYYEILAIVSQTIELALAALANDDRIEFTVYGFQVKIWRTHINCTTKIHKGYKSGAWVSDYSPLPDLERFATILYDHRGSGPCINPA